MTYLDNQKNDFNSYKVLKKLISTIQKIELIKPENAVKEIAYTKYTLLPHIKEIFTEEIKKGLIIRGPINPLKGKFFDGDYLSDISISFKRKPLIGIEVKLLKSEGRHQSLSTAIGQTVIYSLKQYERAILLIIDEKLNIDKDELTMLRKSLYKNNVTLIYFNFSKNDNQLRFMD